MNANINATIAVNCLPPMANAVSAVADAAKAYGRAVKAYYLFLPSLIIACTTGGDQSETHKKFLDIMGTRSVKQTASDIKL